MKRFFLKQLFYFLLLFLINPFVGWTKLSFDLPLSDSLKTSLEKFQEFYHFVTPALFEKEDIKEITQHIAENSHDPRSYILLQNIIEHELLNNNEEKQKILLGLNIHHLNNDYLDHFYDVNFCSQKRFQNLNLNLDKATQLKELTEDCEKTIKSFFTLLISKTIAHFPTEKLSLYEEKAAMALIIKTVSKRKSLKNIYEAKFYHDLKDALIQGEAIIEENIELSTLSKSHQLDSILKKMKKSMSFTIYMNNIFASSEKLENIYSYLEVQEPLDYLKKSSIIQMGKYHYQYQNADGEYVPSEANFALVHSALLNEIYLYIFSERGDILRTTLHLEIKAMESLQWMPFDAANTDYYGNFLKKAQDYLQTLKNSPAFRLHLNEKSHVSFQSSQDYHKPGEVTDPGTGTGVEPLPEKTFLEKIRYALKWTIGNIGDFLGPSALVTLQGLQLLEYAIAHWIIGLTSMLASSIEPFYPGASGIPDWVGQFVPMLAPNLSPRLLAVFRALYAEYEADKNARFQTLFNEIKAYKEEEDPGATWLTLVKRFGIDYLSFQHQEQIEEWFDSLPQDSE